MIEKRGSKKLTFYQKIRAFIASKKLYFKINLKTFETGYFLHISHKKARSRFLKWIVLDVNTPYNRLKYLLGVL